MTAIAPMIHPFEKAGCGKAPFKFIGMEYQEIAYGQRVIGSVGGCAVTTKPGGTCDVCGAHIVDMYRIESADGNRFHVGSDCALKTSDAVLVKVVSEAAKKHKKEKKAARDAAIIAAAIAKLPSVRGQLAEQPHPNEYRARNGETLLDWVRWMLDNAGTAGRLNAARIIETAR